MSIILVPATMQFAIGSGISQRSYGQHNESTLTGSGQWQGTGEPRWMLTLVAPKLMRADEAGTLISMLLQLRGRANHLAAWNPTRPLPAGTARSAASLSASAARGANTIGLSGGGGTLKAGDYLQIGSMSLGGGYQLVCVAADGTAPGSVLIEPPLRQAFAAGTPVVLDKPRALYKLSGEMPEFVAGASSGMIQGFKFNLLEQWT